jgi:flagellar biosynthesis/type III secretory pathway protein FliH
MSVESCRSELSKEVGKVTIDIQEEKGLAKNECIIEGDHQMIDCGIKTQIDNLTTTLRMLVQER